MIDRPYFFSNPAWYEVFLDKDDMPAVRLTDIAPKEAINSFNEYFKIKKSRFIFEVDK